MAASVMFNARATSPEVTQCFSGLLSLERCRRPAIARAPVKTASVAGIISYDKAATLTHPASGAAFYP
jgi:hypothetical protein